jgi:hypothetical protein
VKTFATAAASRRVTASLKALRCASSAARGSCSAGPAEDERRSNGNTSQWAKERRRRPSLALGFWEFVQAQAAFVFERVNIVIITFPMDIRIEIVRGESADHGDLLTAWSNDGYSAFTTCPFPV